MITQNWPERVLTQKVEAELDSAGHAWELRRESGKRRSADIMLAASAQMVMTLFNGLAAAVAASETGVIEAPG